MAAILKISNGHISATCCGVMDGNIMCKQYTLDGSRPKTFLIARDAKQS